MDCFDEPFAYLNGQVHKKVHFLVDNVSNGRPETFSTDDRPQGKSGKLFHCTDVQEMRLDER